MLSLPIALVWKTQCLGKSILTTKNEGGKAENQVPSFSGSSCRSVPLAYFAPTTLVFGFPFE